MKSETSAEQEREWFPLADKSKRNEVNQKAKGQALQTLSLLISSRANGSKRYQQ
jgi:hypothetical protein